MLKIFMVMFVFRNTENLEEELEKMAITERWR